MTPSTRQTRSTRYPGVSETPNHWKAYWVGVLSDEARSLPDDDQLGLELLDATASRAQLGGLGCAEAGNIDSNLLDPLPQRDRMDTQLRRGLLLLFAGPGRPRATALARNSAG